MAYQGKLPYSQRMETMTHQSSYHTDDVCGSNLHGLATTLEFLAQNNKVQEGLEQISRCINARKAEIEKRSAPDPAHNAVVVSLSRLYRSYSLLLHRDAETLKSALVRFSNASNFFRVFLGNLELNEKGGRKLYKKSRRHKTYKKSRKHKTHKKSRKHKTYKK